jgi:hypothetical protein
VPPVPSSEAKAYVPLSHQISRPMRGMRRLTGQEVDQLISGARISPRTAPAAPGAVAVSIPQSEFFSADGRYVRVVEHARTFGTYAVKGAHLCVTVTGETARCRSFLIDRTGNISMVFADSPDRPIMITVSR